MSGFRLKRLLPIFSALILSTLGMQAIADDIDDVNATTEKWATAFNHKSTDEIVALYANDAVFFGTSSPVLRDTPALIREYFGGFANLGDVNMAIEDHRVQVFGDVAISTGYYTMTTNDNGELTPSNARFTFAYAKRNGEWIIIEHHSSSVPGQ